MGEKMKASYFSSPNQAMSTVKVQIYLQDGTKAEPIYAEPYYTIRTMLFAFKLRSELDNIVVFTGLPPSQTPIINLDSTLQDINMWHLDKDYVAEFSVYNKAETSTYPKELYDMYLKHT